MCYCSGEPEQVRKTETETFSGIAGALHTVEVTRLSCALDPDSCGKFKTCSQIIQNFKDEHPSRVPLAKSEK
ncbi:hypothetical protein ES703_45062 [subsurface metagenome]